jgi:hypothetical protein
MPQLNPLSLTLSYAICLSLVILAFALLSPHDITTYDILNGTTRTWYGSVFKIPGGHMTQQEYVILELQSF